MTNTSKPRQKFQKFYMDKQRASGQSQMRKGELQSLIEMNEINSLVSFASFLRVHSILLPMSLMKIQKSICPSTFWRRDVSPSEGHHSSLISIQTLTTLSGYNLTNCSSSTEQCTHQIYTFPIWSERCYGLPVLKARWLIAVASTDEVMPLQKDRH